MRKTVTAVTLADTCFLLLLSLSGSFEGVLGRAFYFAAFLLPFLAAIMFAKREKLVFGLKPLPENQGALLSLPLLVPFVALVFTISFITSVILNAMNFKDTTDVSGNIFIVILNHAVLPSFLEELLFRFVPIALIAPYSKKNALFFSALFFSLIHCNLFQIPYALAAGVVLSFVCIISGSVVLPAVFHFINNLLSIAYMRNATDKVYVTAFFVSMAVLLLVSLVFIVARRKSYKKLVLEIFGEKCKLELTLFSVLFVLMTVFIAITNLWVNV